MPSQIKLEMIKSQGTGFCDEDERDPEEKVRNAVRVIATLSAKVLVVKCLSKKKYDRI